MSKNGSPKRTLFLAPPADPAEVMVGHVQLVLDDVPLADLDRVWDVVTGGLLEKIQSAQAVAGADGKIDWAATLIGLVGDVLGAKIPRLAAGLLESCPENAERMAGVKCSARAARALGLEEGAPVPADRFADWVVAELRPRQAAALADALAYVVGVDELGKSLRSAGERVGLALGKAKTAPPPASPNS